MVGEREREEEAREKERKGNSRAYLERVASGKTLNRQAPRRFAVCERHSFPLYPARSTLCLALLHTNIRFFPPPPPTMLHMEADPTRLAEKHERATSRAAAVSSFFASPSPSASPFLLVATNAASSLSTSLSGLLGS